MLSMLSGVCQSLLKGPPTLAVPTQALYVSRVLKKRNLRKVSRLHRELVGERTSLLARCEDTDSLYLLSGLSDPEARRVTPAFLLNQVVTTETLLPLPQSEPSPSQLSQASPRTMRKMKKLVNNLPHQHYYNPLHHRRTINPNNSQAKAKTRKK